MPSCNYHAIWKQKLNAQHYRKTDVANSIKSTNVLFLFCERVTTNRIEPVIVSEFHDIDVFYELYDDSWRYL